MKGEGFEHGMNVIPFQQNENAKLSNEIAEYYILKICVTRIIFSEFTEFRCCFYGACPFIDENALVFVFKLF